MIKINISEEKKKKPNKKRRDLAILEREGGKRVYVLRNMVITAPTFQAERSPLKASAS